MQACRRPRYSPLFLDVTAKKPNPGDTDAAAPDFERSLAELEAIVDKLEQGELSLDESLKHFERGVQLTRVCQTALKQAEQKVQILLRKGGGDADQFDTADFDADADERER
jgi:exodeoxyribonuclease VII small subunit